MAADADINADACLAEGEDAAISQRVGIENGADDAPDTCLFQFCRT